ncbi:cupin domain-containing protein [Nocardioides jensenii]|uniref:cupin domain-containing protein n=1 Tax=Nocardioides jensenii TaxID=1843 RepID=UPI00083018F1|nr:cupin domain-containing protein [Nocardioides jensenii]
MTSLRAVASAPHDAAAVYNHVDMLCRIVLGGPETGGAFALVEERAAWGAMTPQHLHAREAETFIVVDGALEAWCEGTTTLVEAGTVIHLPAGRAHAFRVASDTAHFYNVITPAGFESFFRDTGTLVAQPFDGTLPVPGPIPSEGAARMQAVLEPLGCSITGPPPFPGGPD